MLKNYLNIALRNLRLHKGYAFINITGLATGIACCLLILLYVQHELSYDRFHDNADRIYRIVEDYTTDGGGVSKTASTYAPVAPTLGDEFPAVELTTRFYPYSVLISRDLDRKYQEDRFFYADSTVFEVFTFPFLQGDPATALDEPFTVVLTKSAARKYFGSEDPMGQLLTIDNTYDFRVTGVAQDVPDNAHFQFDFLASFSSVRTIEAWAVNNWWWPPMHAYALLQEGQDVATLEEQLPAFATKYIGELAGESRSFHLQPLTEIHLYSDRENEISPPSNITYVYLFSAVAFFILLIACVNFMNLTTARSARRAKEVGMRKVMGAARSQLIRQFLSESLLLSLIALVLAVALVQLTLPAFNQLAGKSLILTDYGLFTGALLVIILLVGLLAGSYPAFYLSAFRPIKVLKGKIADGRGTSTLRKGLVVFQFAISSVLIIGTAIIYSQLDYLQNKTLGFDKEHLVVVPLRVEQDQQTYETLKQAWLQDPNVLNVAVSYGIPGRGTVSHFQVTVEAPTRDSLFMPVLAVDHDFVETFNMELAAGRDFSEDFGTDTEDAFMINETAARRLGWDDPVGQELVLNYKAPNARFVDKPGRVIGVVKDFHHYTLHQAIEPLLLHVVPPSFYNDFLSVRVRPTNIREAIASLEEQWSAFNPNRPFEYFFLDDEFQTLYEAETRLGSIFTTFAFLAILIACLGLFGLVSFMAERRTKEIGVRKVLGASVANIVWLLSTDFLKLVGLAFVVASPVAYLVMSQWLQNFAYHVDIGLGTFLLAGTLALLVALLTVGYQAVKAALTDPATSLRYE